jgi:hypothetical protein
MPVYPGAPRTDKPRGAAEHGQSGPRHGDATDKGRRVAVICQIRLGGQALGLSLSARPPRSCRALRTRKAM